MTQNHHTTAELEVELNRCQGNFRVDDTDADAKTVAVRFGSYGSKRDVLATAAACGWVVTDIVDASDGDATVVELRPADSDIVTAHSRAH